MKGCALPFKACRDQNGGALKFFHSMAIQRDRLRGAANDSQSSHIDTIDRDSPIDYERMMTRVATRASAITAADTFRECGTSEQVDDRRTALPRQRATNICARWPKLGRTGASVPGCAYLARRRRGQKLYCWKCCTEANRCPFRLLPDAGAVLPCWGASQCQT